MPRKVSVAASYQYRNRASAFSPWDNHTSQWVNMEELLISQNHRAWRSQTDGGGPFLVQKTLYEISPGPMKTVVYEGPACITSCVIGSPYSLAVTPSTSQINALGTTAISRVLPTNPSAQLSVALGELTNDGLPHVIGSTAFKNQVRTAHQAGDEYLNYQFGWLPLVSDLKKFAHAVKHRHEIMYSYKKYSGKEIRRRYNYPSDSQSRSAFLHNQVFDGNIDAGVDAHGNYSTETKNWFSGAFKYYIPLGSSFEDKAAYYQAEASKILGLELTPEVVWNLAPWSWAVDWFSNTGDVIHNISRLGKDGLAMRYGYEMYSNTVTEEVFATGSYGLGMGLSSHYKKTQLVKYRVPATPFGFGLSYNGLSNTQKAVIGALGLTRAF